MKELFNNWRVLLLFIITTLSYYYFAYELDRQNFYLLLSGFLLAFTCYFYFLKTANLERLSLFIGIGILLRCIFLFSIPSLSDDYYRFIWDGQLLANGINPFDLLPSEVQQTFPNKKILLDGMNSANYYTVYPPIAQLIYFISVKLSPQSILGSVIVMRSIILIAELGTIFLLPKLLGLLKLNPINSLWYILNPLVIVELTGNLHFEGIVIFFFLLSFYLLVLNKQKLSSIPWALAAATKLIPIFFLPILLRKIKFKKASIFYLLFGISFLALWLPFYNSNLFSHFKQSVDLYYETFEFNASFYYLVRWVGYQFVDYNIIGTAGNILGKLALVGMLLIYLQKRNSSWKGFFGSLLLALTLYYSFALIVHPWYICTLVFLSVFTTYRFAIVWSLLVVLSYVTYISSAYLENYWLVAIEYLIVGYFFIGEVFMKRKSFLSLDKTNQ